MTANTATTTSSGFVKQTIASLVVRAFMGSRPACTPQPTPSSLCSLPAQPTPASPQPSALQACTRAFCEAASIAAGSAAVLVLLASAMLSTPTPRVNTGTRQVTPISNARGGRKLPSISDLDERLPVVSLAESGDCKHQEMCSEKCPICLDCVGECTKVRILPCQHYYHAECIDSWVTTQSTLCPMCKSDCMGC